MDVSRELRVAFSLKTQPLWFRVAKWVIVAAIVTVNWGKAWLWPAFALAIVFSLGLHFYWRHKTKGWTQPWGGWKHKDFK
jgi:hypothetical protein